MERGVTKRIVMIGSGNVASHLARSLDNVGSVVQVMSRDITHASRLASTLRDAVAVDSADAVTSDADLYVIAVSDDAISPLTNALDCSRGLWVHTSGSVPMTVFEGKAHRYGVLYPLQTFSRDVAVDMSQVPFFVEGHDDDTAREIHDIAGMMSRTVYYADSELRRRLHVAAVFACNFTCQLWAEADGLLHDAGLPFSTLLPLIGATFDKVKTVSPREAMTGPARRGDRRIVETHKKMLDGERRDIYAMLSERIMNVYDNRI
ncbi:MAG: F420-dependent NADP oxidoreductase [Pseudoflavonifractor sp.]|nr:F420-dependent NADP oxidoreductase [Pseudoflavonifractor sp.]